MKKIIFSMAIIAAGLFMCQQTTAQTANQLYFEWVDYYRYLLGEDKKAARTIYEAQLTEAREWYEHGLAGATDFDEKEQWKAAYFKTKKIITEVYEEELQNLQNAFEKAVEQLGERYRRRPSRKTKQG